MAVIPLQLPTIAPGNAPDGAVVTNHLPMVAGQTSNKGDVLILSAGAAQSAATNPASALLGLALHDSLAVFAAGGPGSNAASKEATPFGKFTSGFDESVVTDIHFLPFDGAAEVVFSFDPAVTLAQSIVGSQVGIVKDATTGIYYVSTAGTNKVAVIREIKQPAALGYGVIGTDTGGRVVVAFLDSALAIV
jgi:hypothetical protein